jgi:pimeloyl-ACP methyl ester carboxylesterase
MKKFISIAIFIFCLQFSNAQKNIAGIWEGKLAVGATSLRIVLHIKNDSAGYSATMDSPDQGAKNIKTSGAVLRGDSLIVSVPAIGGKLSGLLQNDSTFTGEWFQGTSVPLNLKKVAAASTVNRPQTPKPPFAYISEDVIYYNKDKSIQYGATLTMPKDAGPFPAMILITGSGQQNRDEELFGHKLFLVLADYITKKGYAVLRVDDRGVGQTTGDVKNATSKDFAGDVQMGLNYLKTRQEVDKTKLGLLGHSEGGMIAQIVAAERKNIDFVISLAGPGQKIIDLMAEQNAAILKSSGVSAQAADNYKPFYVALLSAVANAPTDTVAKRLASRLTNAWLATTPATIKNELFPEQSEAGRNAFIDGQVKLVRSPWFNYFIKYNPAPFIQKMRAKVLVLNGEKDIQVVPKQNLAAWKKWLQKSSVKKYDVIELKGLNHLFQHCTGCTVAEYGTLEETIAPEAMEVIGDWLKKNVK